ncbi:hypothetical protein RHSIM_Rhsim10G0048600 [Rhododendron simsii]|uniref:NTF2 domain-containing protein n=1 Tax=Rhododendron simsii TaxID=118357 RepID=A0A834GFQ3_RHOSS|nr:hypothetical protein RHSIM_Rhsim10G0048600 [Rhododendron simsii]
MDTQTSSPPPPPPAKVIGKAFVEQYYHMLYESPELVHRFYQESSVLSRPNRNGEMTSVTTTEQRIDSIEDMICSFHYKNYKAEIKTADAQESYKDGVIVLVTGCLTGMDDIRRKFKQTFFLAPQDKGYFVLNDVFRYVEDSEPLESNKVIVNGIHDAPLASITPDPGPAKVYVQANTSRVDPTKTEKQAPIPVAHDPVTEPSAPSASGSVNAPQSGNAQEEAEGHSIYVRNLPLNVTDSQLEEEFTKFGPIKQGGVQV